MKAQSAGAPSPPTDTARTEAGARALLLGKSGFVEGKVIPLRDDVAIIGRSPDCAVHVPDGQVSKVHARLDWTGTTYRLTSLGKNGTTVNGTAVEAPRPLAHGDDIALGASSLHFRLFA
jgi:pSer/pThr/pTyr-binding forkhead associated (FHA) protein